MSNKSYDVPAARAAIADSLLDQGVCVSKPYRNDAIAARVSSAKVVSVLTERDGAEACEYVLPQTAKAIVAAFDAELFRAQGFSDDYVLHVICPNGKPLTKTELVRLAGNSVCPDVAEALWRAAMRMRAPRARRAA